MSGPLGRRFDVVVVGAGVLGCAIAAELAQTALSVCVLEAAPDVAEGASKANAGITSSFYAPPPSIECELIGESNDGWEELCGRLNVPYRRIGALTVAFDDDGVRGLDELETQVRAAGVKVERVTGEQARRHEPLLTDECIDALYYPDEGIIDPVRLTWAYAELAALNGAELRFRAPVLDVARDGDGRLSAVVTPEDRIACRYVVNAAGIGSGALSALAGGEEIRMWPRKGQYWILDRDFGQTLSRIVLPVPTPTTRGIEVAPTTNGSVLLGPDAEEGGDAEDRSTSAGNLRKIFAETQRLVPTVSLDRAIKTYAGSRPAADEPVRLRFDARVDNLIHAGNRSTGVSTSPAFGRRVKALLADRGENTAARPDRVTSLPPVPRVLLEADPVTVLDRRPGDAMVVCVCEQVTAAEITAAVTSAVPARSIEGVRKRCRATGGRCQGSICMAGVILLTANAHGIDPGQVGMGPGGGSVGCG
ncbi:MAG: dependent oxidoreductase [Solirubrobacterales bacterium]|nr:dependent oxidoreductase [Solirubrobacterales bacterium]